MFCCNHNYCASDSILNRYEFIKVVAKLKEKNPPMEQKFDLNEGEKNLKNKIIIIDKFSSVSYIPKCCYDLIVRFFIRFLRTYLTL